MKKKSTVIAILAAFVGVIANTNGASISYSRVNINSGGAVNFAPTDNSESTDGSDLSLSWDDRRVWATKTESGDYVFFDEETNTSARSSLQTGELGTSVYAENHGITSGSIELGDRHIGGSATAQFGDSFSISDSSGTPFLWNDPSNDTVTFSFGITGETSPVDGFGAPTGDAFGDGGPANFIYTELRFDAYQSGGLDIWNQMNNFVWGDNFEEDYAAFLLLSDELSSLRIGDPKFWYLGGHVLPEGWTDDWYEEVIVDPNTPTLLLYEFSPEGDFDWLLTLDTTVWTDIALEGSVAWQDFGGTVETAYLGPDGTTTYSQSGVFPGTLALSTQSVPDGGPTILMTMTAMFALFGVRQLCAGRQKAL